VLPAPHLAPAIATFGPKVDYPVRRLDDLEIVLNDDNRSPCFYQTAKSRQEFADVIKM